MFYILCEKGYEWGTFLFDILHFKLEMACMHCNLLFGVVILRKHGSAIASLHCFILFPILKTLLKLVIYTFMGHVLTSIDVLCI